MPKYKYVGDTPRSLPALGVDVVYPGQTIDVPEEIDNADFQLVADKKAAAKEAK